VQLNANLPPTSSTYQGRTGGTFTFLKELPPNLTEKIAGDFIKKTPVHTVNEDLFEGKINAFITEHANRQLLFLEQMAVGLANLVNLANGATAENDKLDVRRIVVKDKLHALLASYSLSSIQKNRREASSLQPFAKTTVYFKPTNNFSTLETDIYTLNKSETGNNKNSLKQDPSQIKEWDDRIIDFLNGLGLTAGQDYVYSNPPQTNLPAKRP
jgi:hypothetical protein